MKFKFIVSLLLLFSIASYASENRLASEPTVFDIIMQRVQQSEWAGVTSAASLDAEVKTLSASLLANGSWTDINYTSTATTSWGPFTHLNRLTKLILAYTLNTSANYGSNALYQKISAAFNYWYTTDPRSTNWYLQEIACPQRVGVLLILMRAGAEQLPQTLEQNLIARMKSIGGSPDEPYRGIGSNKVDIATHWIYRGCLMKDDSVLSFGVQQVYYPIFMTTGEGLQYDFSYFQNGLQLYAGDYGVPYILNIAKIANYTLGTQYEISQEKSDLITTFTKDHYLKLIRGKYFLYSIIGRELSNPSGLNAAAYSESILMASKVKNLDPSHAAEYDAAIKRLKGEVSASYQISPQHIHYWKGDYALYNSPDYTFDVRMVSTRTCRDENGNGQNLKGYFLSDGANSIVVDGNEYLDIFPVWDWARIPGVTAPQKTSIPKPAQWGNPGTSVFAGGVSNGTYGVTTYLLNDQQYSVNTTARKSWFEFGNEVVCLGAGIKSTAAEQINTTVNQCLLNGNVVVKANNTETTLNTGTYNYTNNVSWIYHNKVGYFFPKGGNVNLTNNQQSGSWYSINTNSSSSTVNKDVFKLWFNHGTTPTVANYAYIIVPGKSIDQIRSYDTSDIEILINSDSLQVVHQKKLNLWGMVFYKAASFKNSQFTIKADNACALMLQNPESASVQGWLSDPSQNKSEIKLRFVSSAIPAEKELATIMPAAPYAGSTTEFVIDKNTTDSKLTGKTQSDPSTGIESTSSDLSSLFVPNPVKRGENAQLKFQSIQEENVQLKLNDINGRRIISKLCPVDKGENLIPVETSSLNSGIYLISILCENKLNMITKKLLVDQ